MKSLALAVVVALSTIATGAIAAPADSSLDRTRRVRRQRLQPLSRTA